MVQGWFKRCVVAGCVALSCVTVCSAQVNPFSNGLGSGDSIFVPAPREYTRPLQLAAEAIVEGEFSKAVDLVGQVLEDPTIEDYFLQASSAEEKWISLKSQALTLLNDLPARGRELFELKYGTEASRLLDAAVAQRDMIEIGRIAQNYFHTKAGYEATMLQGRVYMDEGRYLSAVRSFQRIMDSPAAVRQATPEVQILLATAWLAGGEPERCEEVLRGLVELQPGPFRVQGDLVDMSRLPEDTVSWFRETFGIESQVSASTEFNWAMFRGNPQRMADSSEGFPLMINRWQTPAVFGADDLSLVRDIKQRWSDQKSPTIPSLNPLAVGNQVVMRTPEFIMGVDLQTGLRTWYYPWDEEVETNLDEATGASGNLREQELLERLWTDGVYGQMSSDSRRLFFVDDLEFRLTSNSLRRRLPGRGGNGPESNQLVCLRLVDENGKSVEGKLSWLIGGEDGGDQPWSEGVFFLGPPLPIDEMLYVLAEFNGEIRLFAVDADTAELSWSRQIGTVNLGTNEMSLVRHAAGATPSYADGLLICPTSTGAVVAVDLSTHAAVWGYQYRPVITDRRGSYFNMTAWSPGDRWLDGSIKIHNGRVLVTPVEDDKLYCLDLLRGDAIWSVDREDMIYLGGISGNTVAMVGSGSVLGLDLESGEELWEVLLAEAAPSGRGYASGEKLYIPTTDSRLLAIDMSSGEVIENVDLEYPLGNLICHDGFVISHDADRVAVFYQDESNREWVAQRLAADANDLNALLIKAQLEARDREWGAAIDTVQQVLSSYPDSFDARQVLVTTLMLAARHQEGFDFQPLVAYEEVILESSYRNEYLMLRTQQSMRDEQYGDAIEALLLLASDLPFDEYTESKLIRVGEVEVDPQRWAYATLQEVVAREPGVVQDGRILEMITAAREQAESSAALNGSLVLHRMYGEHWPDPQFALGLAERLIQRERALEAESILVKLAQDSDPEIAASALTRLGELFAATGFNRQAFEVFELLAAEYPQVAVDGESTEARLADFLASHDQELAEAEGWNRGWVDVQSSERSTRGSYRFMGLSEYARRGDFAPRDLNFIFTNSLLVINDKSGRRLASINLSDGSSWQVQGTRGYALSNHLMVIEVTFNSAVIQLVGIDLFKAVSESGDPVIWRERIFGTINPMNSAAFLGSRRMAFRSSTTRTSMGITIESKVANNLLVGEYSSPAGDCMAYLIDDQLVCLDIYTGEVLWRRSGIEPGGRCLADEQTVWAVKGDDSQAVGFRMLDGLSTGEQELVELGQVFSTPDSYLVGWEPDKEEIVLRCWDLSSGEANWSRRVAGTSRVEKLENHRLAIFQADGTFEILDLLNGDVVFSAEVPADSQVQSIQVLDDEFGVLLVVNHNGRTTRQTSRLDPKVELSAVPSINPLVDGYVYAFNRDGSHQWPNRAVIDQFSLQVNEASKAPLLLFARGHVQTGPTRGQLADLVIINRRDGQLLVEEHGIAATSTYWMMEADRANHRAVISGPKQFIIDFTQDPVPPGPAASTGSMASQFRRDSNFSFQRVLNVLGNALSQ